MSTKRSRVHQLTWDPLEQRLALSATGIPANTLAVVQGNVPAPHAVSNAAVPVSAHNIDNRHSIIVGTEVSQAPGSGLIPQVVSAQGPSGEKLSVREATRDHHTIAPSALAYIRDGQPGTLTAQVAGRKGTTGSYNLQAYLPGDLTGDGQVTVADLKAFTKAYLSTPGDANYTPAADANHNGVVGQVDGQALVRNITPLGPKVPLTINLWLGPKDAVLTHHSSNSGGVTYNKTPTIQGRTTPGSIVFTDSGLGDYTFTGAALATDANGRFSQKVTLTSGINNFDFLVIDPYGQRKIQDFPIFWVPFASGKVS